MRYNVFYVVAMQNMLTDSASRDKGRTASVLIGVVRVSPTFG